MRHHGYVQLLDLEIFILFCVLYKKCTMYSHSDIILLAIMAGYWRLILFNLILANVIEY